MKRPWVWVSIVANLASLIVLVFVYPNAMLSPGPLVPAHAELADQCFACHTALRGAASDRCVSCHAVADIGVRTTRGAPIARPGKQAIATSFHQELSGQNCGACHGEHGRATGGRFSHDLLRQPVRDACVTCHAPPKDAFHQQLTAACSQCHVVERWKPSTFDHSRSFQLDRDHNVKCATCHVEDDFKRYTCFGCHDHTPENIRGEHEEEGISNFDDCVSCHRSADEEGGEGHGRERDDDD